MARPRDMQDGKKTEPFTVRLPESEALQLYRLATQLDIQPAVLLRRFARLGMASTMRGHRADEYQSCRNDEHLSDAEDSGYGLLTGTED